MRSFEFRRYGVLALLALMAACKGPTRPRPDPTPTPPGPEVPAAAPFGELRAIDAATRSEE
jgi:hypothetical protein